MSKPALSPSIISAPLREMNIRWDGIRPAAGGMQTLDSPRFGMTRNNGSKPHQGVDLDAKPGTPVLAIADGTIEQIRHHEENYGQDILLKFCLDPRWGARLAKYQSGDADGILYAQYAHLSRISVHRGQLVRRGQVLGLTGTSGNADQRYPHLHFEIRKVRWPGGGLGNRVNPELLFPVNFIKPFDALERFGRTA